MQQWQIMSKVCSSDLCSNGSKHDACSAMSAAMWLDSALAGDMMATIARCEDELQAVLLLNIRRDQHD